MGASLCSTKPKPDASSVFREHQRIQKGVQGFAFCRKQVHLDGAQLSRKELVLIQPLQTGTFGKVMAELVD